MPVVASESITSWASWRFANVQWSNFLPCAQFLICWISPSNCRTCIPRCPRSRSKSIMALRHQSWLSIRIGHDFVFCWASGFLQPSTSTRPKSSKEPPGRGFLSTNGAQWKTNPPWISDCCLSTDHRENSSRNSIKSGVLPQVHALFFVGIVRCILSCPRNLERLNGHGDHPQE